MSKPQHPVLYKTILNLNFQAQLPIFERIIVAAQEFPEFPHWKSDGRSITLMDHDKHCSLYFDNGHIIYDQDSSDEVTEENNIEKATNILLDKLDVPNPYRLAYRRQYVTSALMNFEALVSVMNINLLSQNDDLRAAIPYNVTDLLYRIDCTDDEDQFKMTLGPVHRHEVVRYIPMNLENNFDQKDNENLFRSRVAKFPEIGVYIEIDATPLTTITRENTPEFVSRARSKINDLVLGVNKYLFSTEITQ